MPRPRKTATQARTTRTRQEPRLGAPPEQTAGDWLAATAIPNVFEEEAFADEDALRDETEALYDAFDRGQAQAVAVPYHVWRTLSERQKKQAVDEFYIQQREALEAAEEAGSGAAPQFPVLDLTERNSDLKTLRRPEEFQAYAHSLLRKEHFDTTGKPIYLVMCDPPTRFTVDGVEQWYHPGTSYVQIKAVGQKRRQGFMTRPQHRFLPNPTIRCPMDNAAVYGLAGKQCDYLGRVDREVEDHMLSVHPREYQTHLREIERKREEQRLVDDAERRTQDRRTQELMIAALEKIAGQSTAAAGGSA